MGYADLMNRRVSRGYIVSWHFRGFKAARHTRCVEAHVLLSKRLMREQRVGEAAAQLWPAVQAAPREASAPLRFQLALALSLDGQHEVAEPLLEQVLTLEPEFAEAVLCLCSVQESLGKLHDAAEVRALLRSACTHMGHPARVWL